VDNRTKRNLKQPDQFIAITESGIGWASSHRQTTIIAVASAVAFILLLAGGITLYQHRSNAAATAFGAAMETYNTPLATPGQAVPPGMKTYTSAAERANAANAAFVSVAHQYGMERSGKLAQYFAGLTYMEEGQNGSAEDTLKKVAGDFDKDIAALGKLALAQLYQQTGRDAQATDLYNELTKSNATTVPSGLAQLQLAAMYNSEGKVSEARTIYAKLKDSDKDKKGNPGPAGTIAEEKLNPKAAAPALPQQ
jgi:tetratricopeptide (TPR) repeat protein